MDQFEGLFPFYEKQWQDATRHFALAHLSRSLEAGLTPAQQANLSITHISTRPNMPLNTLVRQQSCKGLTTHTLVKGVAFVEGDVGEEDETLPTANPISLRALLPNGGLTDNGLTPTTAVQGFRVRLVGATVGETGVDKGLWYAPLAKAARDAALATQAAGRQGATGQQAWQTGRSERRHEQRKAAAAAARARAAADRRSGEHSDDSTREVNAAVMRVSFGGAVNAVRAAVRATHMEMNLGMPDAADGTLAARAREELAWSDAPFPPSVRVVPSQAAAALPPAPSTLAAAAPPSADDGTADVAMGDGGLR